MKVHFYDTGTGVISPGWMSGSAGMIAQNIPRGMAAITGVSDHLRQRVDVTVSPPALVPYEPPPPTAQELASKRDAQVRDRIEHIERASLLARPVREALLASSLLSAKSHAAVKAVDDEIVALREQMSNGGGA